MKVHQNCYLSPACPLGDVPVEVLNTNFCVDQVLPPCVKSFLAAMHNYSEIDGIVLPIKNVMVFSVRPIIYFLIRLFLLISLPLCIFVQSSRVICIVNSISSLDEVSVLLFSRANVEMNIVQIIILIRQKLHHPSCLINSLKILNFSLGALGAGIIKFSMMPSLPITSKILFSYNT